MRQSLLSTVLLIALCAAIFAMAIAAQDRTHLSLVVSLAFGAGGLVVWLWRRNDFGLADVLIYAVAFRLVLVLLPPSLSDDSYRYVWDGLVQIHGINPYQYTPSDPNLAALQDDPVYDRINSLDYFSVYPPVSQIIFASGALFHDRGWIYSHYAIKLIFVLMEIGAVFLLARRVGVRWLMLYAWNPLVLLETAGQAHTESALLLLLIIVVYCVDSKRGRLASVALAIAGWIKLYPFVLFPFLWRRFKWHAVWPGALVAVLLALPYAAHYAPGNVLSSLDLYARLFEFNAGLYLGIKKLFFLFTNEDWSKQIGPMLRLGFLVGLPLFYALDSKFKWPIAHAFLVTIGFYLLMATTIHPWYLVCMLFLAVLLEQKAWHWHWLGLFSIGTYLLYVGGPYWVFVVVGWGGWCILAVVSIFQPIMRFRARKKFYFISPYISRLKKKLKVMDLGAGEGYVGMWIQKLRGADVTLVDVIGFNRTNLKHVIYDGKRLPYDDDSFDVVILYFVLHHAADAQQVLQEALRVSSSRVIVVESVYRTKGDLRILTAFDKGANRVRSWGRMRSQEELLHFRRVDAWRELFRELRAEIVAERQRGRWFYRQALFVLRP